MSSYLITGSSRGIGLCLVTILAQRPADQVRFIAATARSKTPALQTDIEKYTRRVVFVTLETHKQESLNASASEVEGILGPNAGLDCLINNAGVIGITPGGISEM